MVTAAVIASLGNVHQLNLHTVLYPPEWLKNIGVPGNNRMVFSISSNQHRRWSETQRMLLQSWSSRVSTSFYLYRQEQDRRVVIVKTLIITIIHFAGPRYSILHLMRSKTVAIIK